ncbi:MAG: hypothetical protein [Caudoviricetes sp.]|nr:MAG: hypothetical protein [Caudoviricetes sp.]
MAHLSEHDRDIAIETCKHWLKEQDAAYLAKEDLVVYWESFNNESKRGEWTKLKPREVCRIIKATRAGLSSMKFIKPEILMVAAQESERAYKAGIDSKSNAPAEYFNFNKAHHFTDLEMLTLCMLQVLVGKGWNIEAVLLGRLMCHIFRRKGYMVPSRTLRWRLLRSVADEAGVIIRDRTDRMTVYGVGRFVCIQIEGITDSIKIQLTKEEAEEIATEAIRRFIEL